MYHNYGPAVFKNEYGRIACTPITPVMPVSRIFGKDVPEDAKFDLDTASQVALITENNHTQIGFGALSGRGCYLCIHTASDKAFVVRIEQMSYIGPEASKEIERLKPRYSLSF